MRITNKYVIKMITPILVILLFTSASIIKTYAQEEYRTSKGQLVIKVILDGQSVTISSKELLMRLDYESGKVFMKQKTSALASNNDSIQAALENMEDEFITFEGNLGLDYINTVEHPPQDFQIEGVLYPVNVYVLGSGLLVHRVQGTSSACLLSLSFNLNIDDLYPDYKIAGLNNELQLSIIQSLIARVNE